MISYVHTKAELALAEVFPKEQHVALRPGYFATNVLQQKLGIIAGTVSLFRTDATFDYVTPDDMGNVAGNILSKGQRDGQSVVYIFGPDMLTQRDAFLKVGKGLDKELQVSEANEEDAVESFIASGTPERLAKYLVGSLGERKTGEDHVSKKRYEEGKANVEKYAARPGVRLDDWVSKNVAMFDSNIEDVATAMPESAPEPEEPEEEEAAEEGEEGDGEKKEGDDEKKDGEDEKEDDKKKA